MSQEEYVAQPNSFPVFSKEFIMRPHIVVDHSNKSKKQMEDFLYAFNKRCEAELTYQKNLVDCSKLLQKYIDPTCEKSLSYICSAWKVDNEQRANQAKELADSLRTQVIEPMVETLKSYTNIIKQAEKKFKKLNKDYSNYLESYKKARDKFFQNDTDLKQNIVLKNYYKNTSQLTQDKRNKLITKTMECIKSKSEHEKNYRLAVSQFNEIVEVYLREGIDVLNQLQNSQRTQIKLQSDAIRKLIVCEVSMFKNVEYDLINISQQMEKMYADKDILAFKDQAQKLIVDEEKKDMALKTIGLDKSYFTLSLKNVEQDYHSWLNNVKRNIQLRKVMEIRMRQLTPETKSNSIKNQIGDQILEVQMNQNKQEITTAVQWPNLPKQVFNFPQSPNGKYQKLLPQQSLIDFLEISEIINDCWTKNEKIENEIEQKFKTLLRKSQFNKILAYLFIEQYRVQNRVMVKQEQFQPAAQLIKILIQQCQLVSDAFIIKGVLALIFTFYCNIDEKSKKQFYQQPSISQSEVWKRDDFWEASIFESSHEEMLNFSQTAAFNIQKGEIHSQTLLREKNIIFSQLASHCHKMLMLGITSKNVRRIVGKFCRLYEMGEQQNRDLSKMISNITKQIKQASTQNSSIVTNSEPSVNESNEV